MHQRAPSILPLCILLCALRCFCLPCPCLPCCCADADDSGVDRRYAEMMRAHFAMPKCDARVRLRPTSPSPRDLLLCSLRPAGSIASTMDCLCSSVSLCCSRKRASSPRLLPDVLPDEVSPSSAEGTDCDPDDDDCDFGKAFGDLTSVDDIWQWSQLWLLPLLWDSEGCIQGCNDRNAANYGAVGTYHDFPSDPEEQCTDEFGQCLDDGSCVYCSPGDLKPASLVLLDDFTNMCRRWCSAGRRPARDDPSPHHRWSLVQLRVADRNCTARKWDVL